METITISMRRFEELLYKEAAYELKRKELQQSGYVATIDKLLFLCPEEPAGAAEDDF